MVLNMDAAEPWRVRRFAQLVEAHGLRVLRYLQGMLGEVELAEDLAQEVFHKAWSGLPELRHESRARSWLYAIAANTARSHLRRQAGREMESLDAAPGERPDPARALDERVTDRLDILQALAALSEPDREILLLVGLSGLSAVEAAELLDIGVEAARKRWQRACRRFKDEMEGSGWTS